MTSVTFAALLCASAAAAGGESYADAHRVASECGKPIVVMVSTQWCGPCQVMKRTVLPLCRTRGLFSRVCFCVVDPDQEQALAQKLTGGGPVPQLVMFRKTSRGWARRKLIGYQNYETVEQFINQGLAKDEPVGTAGEASKKQKSSVNETAASDPSGDKTRVQPVSN